ncbi:hypothetical protein [Paenibacillus chitinolyticus]|uniref:hypothetical protein n=1 Tax=Paenibacillus chitinolyticus TaxID=79263 RepID=UPI001C44C577|nr:hypothetical protein [Paenibacillus chitinolyticus]MBV6717231.1 hypothetical protein [Paenibacillus chitinolyticus]
MEKNNKVTREQFNKSFKKMNASWSYEDAELNEEEKELLFKRINGEITDEEYNQAFMKGRGKV